MGYNEGDYKCSVEEVKAMLRDQPESTTDMKVLRLSLNKRKMQKVAIKSDDKKSNDKKVTVKTQKHYENIRIYLSDGKKASTQEIANEIGIGISGTKKVLKSMPDIIAEGENKNRRYSLNKS